MPKNTQIEIVNKEYLEDKIYVIRDQRVMFDSDLAKIYGYTTKAFNQQIRNNIDKFENDFMFKLTDQESANLRSKKLTSSWGGSRHGHSVFTEQGIYMLMTVLKGPLAIRQSKSLIRLFKKMKDYVYEENRAVPYQILKEIEYKTDKHNQDIKEIRTDLDKVMENFIDPSTYKEFLILDGMKFDADKAYKKIFRQAKKSIIYIDDYIGFKTLELLMFAKEDVDINIVSDNVAKEPLRKYMLDDFIIQKDCKISLHKSLNKCHDRFIVIDFNTLNERIYYCGASCKDAGKKISIISLFNSNDVLHNRIKTFLRNPKLVLK